MFNRFPLDSSPFSTPFQTYSINMKLHPAIFHKFMTSPQYHPIFPKKYPLANTSIWKNHGKPSSRRSCVRTGFSVAFPWLFHGFPMVFPRDPSVPTRPNPSNQATGIRRIHTGGAVVQVRRDVASLSFALHGSRRGSRNVKIWSVCHIWSVYGLHCIMVFITLYNACIDVYHMNICVCVCVFLYIYIYTV